MRRLVLVNALIFAVLAAAVALAYYSYISTRTSTSGEREVSLMREVVEEKVVGIESRIVDADNKLFNSGLSVEGLIAKLEDLAKNLHVMSVIVLDDELNPILGGYAGGQRTGKEAIEFLEWFKRKVLPDLVTKGRLVGNDRDVRGHLHDDWDGPTPLERKKSRLFSFMKKQSGDKTYYIVIEEDLNYLVGLLFPQYFGVTEQSKRIYQVIDQNGIKRYDPMIQPEPGALHYVQPFVDTVDQWKVRVSDLTDQPTKELRRKRIIDSLFIAGAVLVLLIGLVFLAFAIRRERRANELKSEFISNVSHELKTPLSIISMFGEMLANGRTKGPEQASEYAEIIWRESVRLSRLIDNVLDFAKIERGRGMYEFAESNVGEIVERAVDLVGRRLASAEMSIDVKIEPELPLVQLDGNAFTLAVMNLIDNATKYAADGKRIELDLHREGDRIVLDVRDFGPGIDPDEQEQIFERFYRARAVRLKPIRGSGIGLALVRHILRAHHGDITVSSSPGQGSTFRLWLPI